MKKSKDVGYPLVVWLHGRGGDVMTPDSPGQARAFASGDNFRKRPCFIISPQNPDQLGWNGVKADGVVEIVKELLKNLPIDEKRVYLAGYSMGGYGTFHILAQEPKLFAAGVPIAGGGESGIGFEYEESTDLGFPRRERCHREGEPKPGDGRGAEEGACRGEIHRVSRRKPWDCWRGSPHY